MQKRRRPIAVAAVLAGAVLLLCLGVGTTLAGGSSVVEVRSLIRTDSVGIALKLSEADDGRNFTNMEPGLRINKDPLIENTGERGVWVRVRVEVETDPDPDGERAILEEMGVGWQPGWLDGGDGYLYYTEILEAGEEIGLFLNRSENPDKPYTITLPGAWTQETAPRSITIEITPEAIQAEHFEPDFEHGGLWGGAG